MNEVKYTTRQFLDETSSASPMFNISNSIVTNEGTGWFVSYGGNEELVATNDYSGTIYANGNTVKKRYNPKKKRGELKGANDPSKRLAMLKPTIVYQYIKGRFRPIEQKHLEKRFNIICEILHNAEATQQIALSEKIRDKFVPFVREQELLSCGINTYISQKVLDAFLKATTNKIIKLTPIKNYVRIIPKKIQKKLEEIQKKKLFDAFVILHTDPNDTSVEKTKEEKRDPILFGVINGSNKYYFIADWIDQFCEITINQIIDALDLQKEDYKLPEEVDRSFLSMLMSEE